MTSISNSPFKPNGTWSMGQKRWHKHGGSLIHIVSQGFICKRLKEYKPNCSVLSSQLQEKSGSVFVHIGLHLREILNISFGEMSEIISKALCKYETLIVILDVKYIDI